MCGDGLHRHQDCQIHREDPHSALRMVVYLVGCGESCVLASDQGLGF